ncbi:MAG: hypothetical protein CVU05_01830 [Bacteroidetes bacterium HGW-Bacteroidetes-21]|jgi:uncharacterized repeat protein (TIGR01451 family)|nr:MAG: hypothetical protein CVU05_01830 [Bacteroidetes bacterium HGW-Bacteroidetes-21]
MTSTYFYTCGNVLTGFSAQEPIYGTGYWSNYDPANYHFPPYFYTGATSGSLDSIVLANDGYGPYTFYWIIVNGECGDSLPVTVNFVYNTINAQVFYDYNQNGIKEVNEYGVPYTNMLLMPNNTMSSTFDNGMHIFAIDTGLYSVELLFDSALWTTTTDSIQYINSNTPCSSDTIYFGLFSTTNTDISIMNQYNGVAIANSDYTYNMNVTNYGFLATNVMCTLTFDSLFSFSSSSLPYSINNNVITWSLDTMLPGQNIQIINTFTSPDQTHLGDTLILYYSITSDMLDVDLTNNSGISKCIVRASYDPNDKQVVPMGVTEHGYVLHGQELEYTVRFQNTGNYPAMNIYLRDTISTALDMSTIQIKSSSHPVSWQYNADREIVFTFNNIMLPYEDEDESGSQGYVTYSISPYAGLADYTEVENTAYIYFDLNPPIVTNTSLNTYVTVIPMSAENISYEPAINIYPNPAITRLSWNQDLQTNRIRISNLQGKEILSIENPESNNISIEDLSEGVYIISIQSGKTVKHFMFLKSL